MFNTYANGTSGDTPIGAGMLFFLVTDCMLNTTQIEFELKYFKMVHLGF